MYGWASLRRSQSVASERGCSTLSDCSHHAREQPSARPSPAHADKGDVQAYHSALNEEPDVRQVGNMSILPIKTRIRGPAPLGLSLDTLEPRSHPSHI